ncbi:MAG: glycerate kinase type-2 family protein [Promethearchaeota archaeon]
MINLMIKNLEQLLSGDLSEIESNLRKISLDCLEKAIQSVMPRKLIEKSVKVMNNTLYIKDDAYPLGDFDSIYIIGGGKASADMFFSLEKLFLKIPNIQYQGIINVPQNQDISIYESINNVKINSASHPIPNQSGFEGTRKMMQLIDKSTSNDLIICLISGGGSALLPLPREGIILEELKIVNLYLIASGASIQEINAVRKHISSIKGGNLAKRIYDTSGARLISLIISDVVGNGLDSIASGPSVPDLSTFEDAKRILEKYKIWNKIPSSVSKVIEEGLNNPKLETPKEKDPSFSRVKNYLIGSVESAIQEIIPLLERQGFLVDYFSNNLSGEARDFGVQLSHIISEKLKLHNEEGIDKIALIATGELTVTINGDGVGGRNQEMLLSYLNDVKNSIFEYNHVIIGANLDGLEGNSNAMGCLIDNNTISRISSQNIDFTRLLDENNSNAFFKDIGTEIISGPTGCNVNDLLLILITKRKKDNG